MKALKLPAVGTRVQRGRARLQNRNVPIVIGCMGGGMEKVKRQIRAVLNECVE